MEDYKIKSTSQASQTSSILFADENYILKILKPENFEATVNLLATVFLNENPLINAYYSLFPLQYQLKLERQKKFWRNFALEFTSNDLSIGCFDVENMELVGTIVSKDFTYTPEVQNDLEIDLYPPIINLQETIIEALDAKYQSKLVQKGKVMDLLGVAIKSRCSGSGLLGKMMNFTEYLGRKRGYNYAFCFATNFKSTLVLKRHKFSKIGELNAAEFQFQRKRPFSAVNQQSRYSSIWFKEINIPIRPLL